MQTIWNLDALYSSFECEAFKEDRDKLEKAISDYVQWAKSIEESSGALEEKLIEWIKVKENIEYLVDRMGGLIHLTLSTEAKHTEAAKQKGYLDKLLSGTAQADAIMTKFILKTEEVMATVKGSEKLQAYLFFFEEIIKLGCHTLDEKEEVIISRMRENGSTSWLDYKNLIISTHKVAVEIEGKTEEMPLTMALNLAYDTRKEVRKKAYEAEIASYKQIEEGVAAALNGIKGQVLTLSELRGYASPLHMTLENARMTKETLDAMLSAITESLPVFRTYLKTKANLLGYEKGLPFYELYAPVVENEETFTFEQGREFVLKNFATFNTHLHDFAEKAFDQAWIDVFPKEGKRGGAFCRNLRSIGESRVLLNYGESFSDVITLAHELGHGFHGACLEGQSSLNTKYPMPLAETASTFCETIVKKAAIKEADADTAFAILETEISDATQVIVDIYSRYLFETTVFEKRKEGFVSVEELKTAMTDAQTKAYGDGLDSEYLHPYMWTWKPHYYYEGSNFYNFPYAFGLLFAKGLYAKYLEDKENFPEAYEKLLAVTGRMSIEDVAKTMDINVSDVEFWRGSIRIIEEDVKKFMEIAKQK